MYIGVYHDWNLSHSLSYDIGITSVFCALTLSEAQGIR